MVTQNEVKPGAVKPLLATEVVSLESYNQLTSQEARLVQGLRDCVDTVARKNTVSQIQVLLHKKLQELTNLSVAVLPNSEPVVVEEALNLEEQPLGSVVANKYLDQVVVSVDDKLLILARDGKLQVRASLCIATTDAAIDRTLDNRQEILQGQLVAVVGSDGRAVFNRLKIMEVSSKHSHQSFAIQLQLEEIKKMFPGSVEEKVVSYGNPIRSSPLQVISRMNKRKRSSSASSLSSSGGCNKKRVRTESDPSFVDITSLLVLPQKEAATRLGISESMLCKRFKECTRRKWPYRYLRKIEKMMNVLMLNKKADNLSSEDAEKIEKLKAEREECLTPVKIRITGDSLPALRDNGSDTPTGSDSMDSAEEEFDGDDAEIAQVVSTLNFLRNFGVPQTMPPTTSPIIHTTSIPTVAPIGI
eukprot:TRINITY_DN2280_c0_g1_i1.p1 TRINITY_DN2280_c0_g1~~TRINITY_DN2280_c0_g1_i1.p1  ORF type:complete len:471 (+),score=76.96 TRINITY_DN2280_c0_g1_i1:168-1415(+)